MEKEFYSSINKEKNINDNGFLRGESTNLIYIQNLLGEFIPLKSPINGSHLVPLKKICFT